MTRTYARDSISYDYESLLLKANDEPPTATYFEKADVWVVKLPTGGSFKVLPHQIVGKPDEVAQTEEALPDPEDLAFLRSVIDEPVVDHSPQGYIAKAQEAGMSVGELTDGEYTVQDGHVVASYLAPGSAEEDALLARFGV